VQQFDPMCLQIRAHTPRSRDRRPRCERPHSKLQDGNSGIREFARAKSAAGKAADMRLELPSVQRQRSLRQLAFRAAQPQFPRKKQNPVAHDVIMNHLCMNEQILNRVRQIAGDVLDADVHADSSPSTVESWDSVKHLNLMLALEEEYGFQFLPEEMDEAKSVAHIARLVAAKRA
jgi:acyl carrier protein